MEIFNLEEVAEKLKVSQDTIKRAITRGDMEAYKVGSQWRLSEEQLQAYLTRRTVSRIKKKSLTLK